MRSRRSSDSSITIFRSSRDGRSNSLDGLQRKQHTFSEAGDNEYGEEGLSKKELHEDSRHVFSKRRKYCLVWVVSLAGLVSPLSLNICFPAIDAIAKDLHISIQSAMWSITIYLVFQAIAPSFWGPISDARGRRIAYIGALTTVMVTNFALVFVNDFTSLLVLRALQAFDSSAIVALASGTIADITSRTERGGYVSISTGIRIFGQAFGPVIGGFITDAFGFHSIFRFLFFVSGIVLAVVVFFVPETVRSIAGNGSARLGDSHRPSIYYWTGQPYLSSQPLPLRPRKGLTWYTPFTPLSMLFQKDVFCVMLCGSIFFTTWSMMMACSSNLFMSYYGLSIRQTGLAFIPSGLGAVTGSVLAGIWMDREMRLASDSYRIAHNIPASHTEPIQERDDFPLEIARYGFTGPTIFLFTLCFGLVGFSLEISIYPTLVLQFIVSATQAMLFNINSTFMIDLFPTAGASALAAGNIARCLVASVGVAMIQPLLNALGTRVLFILLGLTAAIGSSLIAVELYCGPKWRRARAAKEKLTEDVRLP
ncbi:florfenicol exporter [Rhizodiscina lignyota]|uniref:Florfenicol exporter n=1 Tax=Rhizodiscina lignyota TaxID=1504668 RepID=A0A9P4MEC1_9PEZI|nr:florfenicol exporter [Rhizodiscina lignyota]